jgi:hypothetical protein
MITSLYRGGLGNILFQVAVGISVAIENNDIYAINPNNHLGRGQGNHISSYIENILLKIQKTNFKSDKIYENFSNDIKKIPYVENLCLSGFFQNYNLFKHNKDQIKKAFNFDFINFDKNKEKKILSIHVRTGDYLLEPNFNIINKNYYEKCLNMLNLDDYEIYLISDFPDIAKSYLPDINYKIFHKSELHDMFLLSQSDACIIPNSTFSWWGSFLGQDKITYVPNIWAVANEDFKDIYHDNMVKVQYDI